MIGVFLLIDILFLLPVTAVPSAILKGVLVELPYSVSALNYSIAFIDRNYV